MTTNRVRDGSWEDLKTADLFTYLSLNECDGQSTVCLQAGDKTFLCNLWTLSLVFFSIFQTSMTLRLIPLATYDNDLPQTHGPIFSIPIEPQPFPHRQSSNI